MTSYDDLAGAPTIVELDHVQLNKDNSFHFRLQLADGMQISYDVPEGSAEMNEILTVLGQLATAYFASLGNGVIVAGITPVEPPDPPEEGS